MKRCISVQQMRELDKQLINQRYQSSYDLLRYAGYQLYLSLVNYIDKDEIIVVICGAKNNGGDGLVVYEHLYENGYDCYAFVDNKFLSEENKLQQNRLRSLQYPLFNTDENSEYFHDLIDKADVIVDALIGIGCSKDADMKVSQVIDKINDSKAQVISIDIASGLLANSGFLINKCIVADKTLAVGAFKYGHFLFDSSDVSGNLELIDIGIVMNQETVLYFNANEIPVTLKTRKNNVHKYHFKHVCVIGGSSVMMGSVALSATASLYAGTGLVSLATETKNAMLMRSLPYEIMTTNFETLEQLQAVTLKKDVIVYGMGVGKDNLSIDVIDHLLSINIPVIVDGDGLFHLSNKDRVKHNNELLITPHLNELSILAKKPIDEIKNDVVFYVQEVAKTYDCTIICKGPTTIVCHQNKVSFYKVGNNGLATAGSGDVFAGLLASQVAQNSNILQAIETTLVIYDKAANQAKDKYGVIGMVASNVVSEIAIAIKNTIEDL